MWFSDGQLMLELQLSPKQFYEETNSYWLNRLAFILNQRNKSQDSGPSTQEFTAGNKHTVQRKFL